MSLYEDFIKTKKTSGTSTGGLYQKFQETKQPAKPSMLSSIASGFKDMIVNPAPAQKEFEKQALPEYYKGDSTIMKVATAPGTFVARSLIKGFSRIIHPGLSPLSDDVAQIYEVSKKGGVADQVAQGKIPKETLDDFEVLKKTAPQIVGDVAQAVLTVYSGGAAKNVVQGGAKQGLYQAFKTGVKENAPIGLLFGGAQVASSGETDIKEIIKTLGVSTATASILGGILKGTIPASKEVTNRIVKLFEEKKIKLPVNFTSKETAIPISTPKTRFADYNKSQGYEPYMSPDELPVIEMGPKPKDSLPVIKMDAGKPRTGELKYDPIKEIMDTAKAVVNEGKGSPQVRSQVQKEIAPRPVLEPKQPQITGETVVPKASMKVEAAAVEKGLVSRFEGLPEAQKMNMKQQANDSANLVNTDFETAKRVAMGDINPPGDLRSASVFEAVKQKALADNDAQLLKDLATKSTVPTRGTALGQEIKAFDTGIDNSDPVQLMQDVIKAREKKVGDKFVKTDEVKSIKENIRKTAPKKEDWNTFINNIEC